MAKALVPIAWALVAVDGSLIQGENIYEITNPVEAAKFQVSGAALYRAKGSGRNRVETAL